MDMLTDVEQEEMIYLMEHKPIAEEEDGYGKIIDPETLLMTGRCYFDIRLTLFGNNWQETDGDPLANVVSWKMAKEIKKSINFYNPIVYGVSDDSKDKWGGINVRKKIICCNISPR